MSLAIDNIYSSIAIGNELNINLRQSAGSDQLSFVSLDEQNGYTNVEISVDGVEAGEYLLCLESFDTNSTV